MHMHHNQYTQIDISKYGIDETWDFTFMWSARGKAKCKGSVVTFIELFEGVVSVGPKLKQLEVQRQTKDAQAAMKKAAQEAEKNVVKTSEGTRELMKEVRARKRAKVEPSGSAGPQVVVAPIMYVPPSLE